MLSDANACIETSFRDFFSPYEIASNLCLWLFLNYFWSRIIDVFSFHVLSYRQKYDGQGEEHH